MTLMYPIRYIMYPIRYIKVSRVTKTGVENQYASGPVFSYIGLSEKSWMYK